MKTYRAGTPVPNDRLIRPSLKDLVDSSVDLSSEGANGTTVRHAAIGPEKAANGLVHDLWSTEIHDCLLDRARAVGGRRTG